MAWILALGAWLLADVVFVLVFYVARSVAARFRRIRPEPVPGSVASIGELGPIAPFDRWSPVEPSA